MNGFWWYVSGFATCLAITIGWYHFGLKPKFDALKDIAERSLRAKAAEIKAKL